MDKMSELVGVSGGDVGRFESGPGEGGGHEICSFWITLVISVACPSFPVLLHICCTCFSDIWHCHPYISEISPVKLWIPSDFVFKPRITYSIESH